MRQRSAEATRVMALARIITRSDECARELSQDLLARGYAVEVVSPDEIPGHTADLELRVETGEGKKLTANVKVQHGEHSASLDFVHHLKPTVGEVSRPEWQQALNVQGIARTEHFANAAKRELVRDREESQLPQKIPLAAKPDPVVDQTSAKPASDTGFASKATDRPEPPQLAPMVLRDPTTVAVATSSTARRVIPGRVSLHLQANRPEGWLWRTAIGFAAMVLVALAAAFSTNRKPLMSNSGETGEIPGTAPIQVMALSAAAAESTAQGPLSKPSVKSDLNRIEAAGQKAGPAARDTASEATGTSVHDLVARDTVVYLDERYKPAPKTKPSNPLARQQPSSRKRGGVIAANSVTYLNDKPTSKPK